MALTGKVGGAVGTLYITAFLRAPAALSEKDEVSAEEAAMGWLKQRGRAEVGDKTMVDALSPRRES